MSKAKVGVVGEGKKSPLSVEESVEKLTSDEAKGVTHEVKVTCFNRDAKGCCLAFNDAVCSCDCEARITTIQAKIDLLTCLLNYAKSRADKIVLRRELDEALRVKEAERAGWYEDWMACYYEDRHRGSGGGSSEHDSNRSTGMKTLMKDNRSVGVKPTKSQMEEYQRELKKWEEENEKLPKLARSSLGKSKIDSYLEPDEDR